MYNLAISLEVENFQMKIYYPAGYRTPDLLNQRQTCYDLSQHDELLCKYFTRCILIITMWQSCKISLRYGIYYSVVRNWIRIAFQSTPVVQWLSYSPLDPRFAGSIPAGVDGLFQSVKIVSMTSFGREVRPWVPYRRFTARKITSSRN